MPHHVLVGPISDRYLTNLLPLKYAAPVAHYAPVAYSNPIYHNYGYAAAPYAYNYAGYNALPYAYNNWGKVFLHKLQYMYVHYIKYSIETIL